MNKDIYPLILFFLTFCSEALYAQCQANELPFSERLTASFVNSCAVYDGKVYFSGGAETQFVTTGSYNDDVDVLDFESETISTLPQGLSVGRAGIMAAAYDGKIFFAGGFRWVNNTSGILVYDEIDVYDVEAAEWDTMYLSQPRGDGAIAVVDGKLVIAGGWTSSNGTILASDVIDIYDGEIWWTDQMPIGKAEFGAGVVGTEMWMCGGFTDWDTFGETDLVHKYIGGEWLEPDTLSVARGGVAVAVAGNYLICAGGYPGINNEGWMDEVDIFDTESGIKETAELFFPRMGIAAASTGDKAFFTGGGHVDLNVNFLDKSTSKIDVFSATNNSWSHFDMQKNRMTHSCAAWEDKIAVGGGWRAEQGTTTGRVEIIDCTASSSHEISEIFNLTIYPNPTNEKIKFELPPGVSFSPSFEIDIYDTSGRKCLSQKIDNSDNGIDVGKLATGVYFVRIYYEGGYCFKKIIKN